MTIPDPFAHDDAAYVLDALPAVERAAFEQHLLSCAACTDRVRDLAALPALLATVPASAYADAPEQLPATALPQLLHMVQAERRRQRWLTGGLAGVAAACLVALAVLTWRPTGPSSTDPPASRPQAMTAVSVATSLHATAALTGLGWGTQITLACRYDATQTPAADYQLLVFDKHNVAHPAGSWKLIPGEITRFTTGTALARDEISAVVIARGERVILQLRL